MTLAAPAARAIPTAKQPIGPHPTMKTVLPGISAVSTVWNALPIGSMMAPISVGMPSSGSTLVAGIAMNSANAPSRSTPMMRVFLQMWPLPVRHCRQWPQTMCPSAVTSWPVCELGDPVSHRDDLAGEFVPDHERRLEATLGPGVPIGDVQVGAADPGVTHRDEHFAGARARLGDAL